MSSSLFKSFHFAFFPTMSVAPQENTGGAAAPSAPKGSKTTTKIVIVGGGAGGLSTASMLQRKFQSNGDIVIVVSVNRSINDKVDKDKSLKFENEPSDKHYYQPLWTLVGGGIFTKDASQRNEKDLIPQGTTWEKDGVATFKPDENLVVTKQGKTLNYDYLIVATGITMYWDRIRGLKETLGKNGVTSNYSFDSVDKTFEFIKGLKSGTAIFTFPNTPIKCGGAPQKILWLADSYFRDHNVRDKININFNTAGVSMFAVKKYSDALDQMAVERDVTRNYKYNLIEVNGEKKEAVFETPEGNKTVQFDMLHVVPPMGPIPEVKSSPLADPTTGYVTVNKETLQHTKYPNVFALGDCSNLPTSKTAAAITKQAPCLVANLISHKNGQPLEAKYDGYTSCPITTSYKEIMLAEFKYDNVVAESFPFDQSKPSRFAMLLKKHVFPTAYWHGVLNGRWFGPRAVFNPYTCADVKQQ
ncbi:putative sulfide quinone reductase [Heterostelium album PN500]|uniref:Sulfide:quinone oxidoreductase, mitochondrial n=1 Tax=Heterostelium pallidum (strain ATCC 26659 / Pp 5 / PN500) TaxID=670386 RepID=D3BQL2_HETP5|nr:putative sulfide quinone reductase [Heterostelium album PN500]EFA76432.1 putative sulfide quinone reductase [Heterostelium album PN500]|eukprot:XP_020428564.1 putative sulfide quinone reductase [Heterostelium album PN500]